MKCCEIEVESNSKWKLPYSSVHKCTAISIVDSTIVTTTIMTAASSATHTTVVR